MGCSTNTRSMVHAESMRFPELLAHELVTEEIELRSTFGFMAFHGGNLERVTDEIAREAARRSGSSYYAIVQQAPLRHHLPSAQVSPDESEHLAAFLSHVDVAVAVHGYGREGFWTSMLLGGTNRFLATNLAQELRNRLPEFNSVDSVEEIPAELRGQHPRNPVNLPTLGGVQLELPPRIRGLTPGTALMPRIDGRIAWTESLIEALSTVARNWPPTSLPTYNTATEQRSE